MAENEKLNNVAVDNDVGTMEDVDAIMKKYDRESNTRVWEGTPRKILRVLTALFGIFLIVMNMWIKMDERARRPLFLGLVIILVFIYYPIKKGSQKVNYMPWYDIVMAAVGAFCFFFYPLNLEKIVTAGTRIQKTFVVQIGSISIPLLIVFAIIGTLILVECCRRVVGMPIICVAAVFVLYAFLGAGKDLKTVMYNLFSPRPVSSAPRSASARPTSRCSSSSAPSWRPRVLQTSSSTARTRWSAGLPAVLQRSRSFPLPSAAWSPVPPSVTPLPPVPSPSR